MSLLSKDDFWQKYSSHFSFCQVREHAAAVLAGLMKGGDEDLVEDFRQRACKQANAVLKQRKHRYINCLRFSCIFFSFPDIFLILINGNKPCTELLLCNHYEVAL